MPKYFLRKCFKNVLKNRKRFELGVSLNTTPNYALAGRTIQCI